MTSPAFVSFAQNREDVVLHRVLREVSQGRYIEIGSPDPTEDSLTRAFYDAGWRGVVIEPDDERVRRHLAARPGDQVLQAAVGGNELGRELAKARSTMPNGTAIHFLSLRTQVVDSALFRNLDLDGLRPWVIIINTRQLPGSAAALLEWEPFLLGAGYRFGLFDGVSRYYLATEHWEQYHELLAVPANIVDHFVDFRWEERELEIQRLLRATVELNTALSRSTARDQENVEAVTSWRSAALGEWSRAVAAGAISTGPSEEDTSAELTFLRNHTHAVTIELAAMKQTLSWRITKPLRSVRRFGNLVNR